MLALHMRDDPPDPTRVLGEGFPQDNPGSIMRDKVIVPVKWFSEETVMVNVAGWELSTTNGVDAVTEKSAYLKRAVVEWLMEELVPVIVTV